jgi:hypothetical protein
MLVPNNSKMKQNRPRRLVEIVPAFKMRLELLEWNCLNSQTFGSTLVPLAIETRIEGPRPRESFLNFPLPPVRNTHLHVFFPCNVD